MSDGRTIPRILVAGTSSGVGKTTVTVGLIGALRARGLRVSAFKCGPDYLDPTYHGRASGSSCPNLDGWMMGRRAVLETFRRASRDADVAVIEGVMGLFDGASATGEEGSSAEVAKWLGAPVLLVVDASGMARTVAAIARGMAEFDPDLSVRGVIGNRVGSRGHLDLLREAGASPPVLGGLPVAPEHAFPSRHLGLFAADRRPSPDETPGPWGPLLEEWVDVPALLEIARKTPPLPDPGGPDFPDPPPIGPKVRIGLALDEAFHFYYEHNLALLTHLGAELVPFSPVRDAALPEVDALYLGGGYPEESAAELSSNLGMIRSIREFAARGGPIYAECGGLMYLADAIHDRTSARHPMLGLIGGEVYVRDRLQALGYVEVETVAATPLGPPGLHFRGHQFRYSEILAVPPDLARAYAIRRRRDGQIHPEGYTSGNVLGTYVHAHWASNPDPALGLVRAASQARLRTEM